MFGRSKKPLDAFIVEFPKESEFSGRLSEVLDVVGPSKTLTANIFKLCQQLAERSASTLGDVLKLAIQPHMPKAFAQHLQAVAKAEMPNSIPAGSLDDDTEAILAAGQRSFVLAEPRQVELVLGQGDADTPAWVRTFVLLAGANLQLGKSTLILVPDYREHEVIMQGLAISGLSEHVSNYSQEQVKSKQYLEPWQHSGF